MKKTSILLVFCFVLSLALTSCAQAKVKRYSVRVVKEYPHDVASFTQGLFFVDGSLYESTGMNGESTFRKVNLSDGKAERKFDFSRKYFVEGSVVLGNSLFILDRQNKVAFVYDFPSLKYRGTVSYPREGWGLTTDGTNLIASDGSSSLFFMDKDFKTVRNVTVKLNGRTMSNLNESEYVDGKVYANVYMTDLILIINPSSGNVEGTIDCTGLLSPSLRTADTDVLNGIAYDGKTKKLYFTGKYWPRLFEVSLVEK